MGLCLVLERDGEGSLDTDPKQGADDVDVNATTAVTREDQNAELALV